MNHKDLLDLWPFHRWGNRGPRRHECTRPSHLQVAGRAELPPKFSALSSKSVVPTTVCRVSLSPAPYPWLCLCPGLACLFPAIPSPRAVRQEAAHQQEHPRRAVAARQAGLVSPARGVELCTGGRPWPQSSHCLSLGRMPGTGPGDTEIDSPPQTHSTPPTRLPTPERH